MKAPSFVSPILALVLIGCAAESTESVRFSAADRGLTNREAYPDDMDADADGDGYGTSVDCDDADPLVHPDAAEDDNLVDDDCDAWVDEDFVTEGDVVVTEINRQSRFGGSTVVSNGGWFELSNRSARVIDLDNWVVVRTNSSSTRSFYIDPAEGLVFGPGERLVFCDTDLYEGSAVAWPLQCDYVWSDATKSPYYAGTYHVNTFHLTVTRDLLRVGLEGGRTDARFIDDVEWFYDATNGYWPASARFSMSLDDAYLDADRNDDLRAWCATTVSAAGKVSNNTAWRWYDTWGTTNDEHGTPGAANYDCPTEVDWDGDGFAGDCDEGNAAINPGAAEVCDGIDNNCDAAVDNDPVDPIDYYADADGDGFGGAWAYAACPGGTDLTTSGDCDDADATVFPGAVETCDGVDENCDAVVDNDAIDRADLFVDADLDGFGAGAPELVCPASGWTDTDTDCDDAVATVYPGATELRDGLDNDCDVTADEGTIASGDLVISEVNRQARFGKTSLVAAGSWVEVHNPSAVDLDLSNWTIRNIGPTRTQAILIDPADQVVVPAGGYAVFCEATTYEGSATAAWPLSCDYVWGDPAQPSTYEGVYHNNKLHLQRDAATFELEFEGGIIDSLSWTFDATAGYWPRDARYSMNLDPAYLDADDNDNRLAWCSTTVDGTGHVQDNDLWRWYDTSGTTRDEYGTPGYDNFDCPTGPDSDGDGAEDALDCAPMDSTVYPGATEAECDGIDQDCEGTDSCPTGLGSLTYDGVDDLAWVPGTASATFPAGMTAEIWMKIDDLTLGEIGVLGQHDCGTASGWFVGRWAEVAQSYYGDESGRFISPVAVADGLWHHLALVQDGSVAALYVDGAVEVTGGVGAFGTATDLAIGLNGMSETCWGRYHGAVADVRIWETARTPEEIAASMTTSLTGLEAGLWAWYDFREGAGDTAYDWSGNGRDAVLGTAAGVDAADPVWTADKPF